jgi:hypothetical protein
VGSQLRGKIAQGTSIPIRGPASVTSSAELKDTRVRNNNLFPFGVVTRARDMILREQGEIGGYETVRCRK